MALFNDGSISSTEDLRAYESSILDTASDEAIDLTVKIGLGQREIGSEIYRFLVEQTAVENEVPTLSLSQVVVTTELQQWHALRTLALAFRDAHHNQLNDRYQAKWQEYNRQAAAAESRFFQIGVGMTANPVSRALAPLVSVSTGVAAPGIFEIRVAWLNAMGQEGALSDRTVFTTQDGSVPVVDGRMEPGDGAAFNVYAGPLGGPVAKQNIAPVLRGEMWDCQPAGFRAGPQPNEGQRPDFFLRKSQVSRRG